MPEISGNIPDDLYKQLLAYKSVVEAVMEESVDSDEYLEIVISRGLVKIVEDIIPKDSVTLWSTIELISKTAPEFFATFVVEILKIGEETQREEAKRKLGFIKENE